MVLFYFGISCILLFVKASNAQVPVDCICECFPSKEPWSSLIPCVVGENITYYNEICASACHSTAPFHCFELATFDCLKTQCQISCPPDYPLVRTNCSTAPCGGYWECLNKNHTSHVDVGDCLNSVYGSCPPPQNGMCETVCPKGTKSLTDCFLNDGECTATSKYPVCVNVTGE